MKALLVVDVQNDFMPNGPMATKGGNEIIPMTNKIMNDFKLVVATQDWHPENHGSFAANHEGKKPGDIILLRGLEQILWPTHCVMETQGADFAPGLNTDRFTRIFKKGTDPEIDSYSGFHDNGRTRSTGLADYLRQNKVKQVTVCGVATDYCVKFTVLDSLLEGFDTVVLSEACRGVDAKPGDIDKAILEMKEAGAKII